MRGTAGADPLLSRAHRVVSAGDFKNVVRHGTRRAEEHVVVYLAARDADASSRFGFIVTKSVGNAVIRNRVRRRLRAIASEIVRDRAGGMDAVVRALPGTAELSWISLHAEVIGAVAKGVGKR